MVDEFLYCKRMSIENGAFILPMIIHCTIIWLIIHYDDCNDDYDWQM